MKLSKNLRYYFTADIISQIGSNISLISSNWFLLEKTGSSEKVGILVILGVIAGLITCFFAGIIADRFNKKSILICSNFIRATAILMVAFLLYVQNFSVYYLYILSIISGIGFNIYLPASKAFVREMTKREVVIKSNGFIEINVQISMLLAGALTGIIYEYFGMYAILALDAITFIIGNFFLYRIEYIREKKSPKYENFFQEFKNGLLYLRDQSSICLFVLIMLLPHVATITMNVVTPGYVLHHLHSDSIVYGAMNMSYGIGATATCLIFIFASHIYFTNFIIRSSFLISIISLIVMIFNTSVTTAYIATLFFGFANSSLKIILLSTIMRVVDAEYMGRVISVKNIVITLLQMIFTYNIGFAMDKYGDVTGYIFLEAIMVVGFLAYIYLTPKIRPLVYNRE